LLVEFKRQAKGKKETEKQQMTKSRANEQNLTQTAQVNTQYNG